MKILLAKNFFQSRNLFDLLSADPDLIVSYSDEIDSFDYEVLIGPQDFILKNIVLISELNELRFIQLISSGYERIDLKLIPKKIQISNSKGIYTHAISEYVLSFILNFYKKTSMLIDLDNANNWRKDLNIETLEDKKVLIIGNGDIGQKLYSLLVNLVGNIRFVYRTLSLENNIRSDNFHITQLNEALPGVDILIVACPLNSDSLRMLNSDNLTLINHQSLILNISREAILDYSNLDSLFQERNITLINDVFEYEQLGDLKFKKTNSIIITPHLAWYSKVNIIKLYKLIRHNIDLLKSNSVPINHLER